MTDDRVQLATFPDGSQILVTTFGWEREQQVSRRRHSGEVWGPPTPLEEAP